MGLYDADVQKLYVAYFNRPADPLGLIYWNDQIAKNGGSITAVANAFSASTEYKDIYAGKTTAQIINTIYTNLFGRPAEPDGLTYWGARLDNGTFNIGTIAYSVYVGAQNADKTAINNKATAAGLFTAAIDTNAEIVGYAGLAANTVAKTWLAGITTDATLTTAKSTLDTTVVSAVAAGTGSTGTTFTLTTGVDTPSSSNGDDTYIADNTGATKQLSTADQINGGSGTDTLKVYLAAGDTTTGVPSLTSIETFYVNGGAITALTAPTGTTLLSIDGAVIGTAATYTLAGQAIKLANFATTTATTTIASTTDTTETITLNGFTRSAVGQVNTLALTGANVTSATIATETAASIITLTNAGAALASLTITGNQALTLTESIATLKTINASAATAAVSVDASGLAADNLMTFTGGSADDTLIFKAGHMLATDTINGGSGTDTIAINDTTPVYAALNGYTSIEKLTLNTTAATVDVAQLTSIRSFGVGTGNLTETFNNSTSASTYKIVNDGNTGTITIANAVGQGTTTVNIDNQNAASKTLVNLTVSGETTINLSSTGIAGSAGNVITTLANADNSSIVITGDKALTITNALAATTVGSSVNASALTAALTVVGSTKADIIIGGTGADVITGGLLNDTLTGGAGADKFYLTTGAAADLFVGSLATTASMDRITDFVAGTDKIGLVNGTTPVTSVVLTSVTVATAADVATLLTAIGNSVGASTAPVSQVGVITVTAGTMAGTYLLINDTANGATATDSLINITGVSGTIATGDFIFA